MLSTFGILKEPTELSNQPITAQYRGHVSGQQPIRDKVASGLKLVEYIWDPERVKDKGPGVAVM